MKILFTALILITALPAFAQNHLIGLKGGISLTNVNSSDFTFNDADRRGFSGGLTYEYQFSPRLNLGLDVLYSQKGFIGYSIFTDEAGRPKGERSETEYNYDYLSFPVKVGFNGFFGSGGSIFLNLGVVPSVLSSAKTFMPGFEGFFEDTTYYVSDKVTAYDFGGLIEVGVSHKLKKRFFLFSSFSYQQSFISITNENYFEQGTATHLGKTISLGLKYALKAE